MKNQKVYQGLFWLKMIPLKYTEGKFRDPKHSDPTITLPLESPLGHGTFVIASKKGEVCSSLRCNLVEKSLSNPCPCSSRKIRCSVASSGIG